MPIIAPRDSGRTLGYTSIFNVQTTTSTTFVDITGLSVVVTAGARPLYLDMQIQASFSCTAGTVGATAFCGYAIYDEANTIIEIQYFRPYIVNANMNLYQPVRVSRQIPSPGNGVVKTYRGRMFVNNAAYTAGIYTDGYERCTLRVSEG